jgi:hypothetical protein
MIPARCKRDESAHCDNKCRIRPPRVAQAFVRDMRAFFKAIKQDEIASRQLHALIAFQRPRDKKLRLADVKEMFLLKGNLPFGS